MTMGEDDLLFLETSGFSMRPFVRHSDRVLVRRADAAGLRTGDIVLYRQQGRQVCHRLVRKEGGGSGMRLYVRGDADRSRYKEPLRQEDVIGKVEGIYRQGRFIKVSGGYRGAINRLIVLLPGLILLALKARSIWRNTDEADSHF